MAESKRDSLQYEIADCGDAEPTMKFWSGVVYALFVFAVGTASSQDKASMTSASEQLQFSASGRVQKTVTIPNDVLLDLKQDKLVKATLSQGHPAGVASLLLASVIHLNSSDEEDLVVIGQGELVSYGNTVFWIYRPSSKGYEMIFTTYGGELTVKNSRTKEYRDLTMVTPDGPRFHRAQYHFDGRQYLVASETY